MKKLFISILAVAMLASCSKSDVIFDEPSEIGFVPATKMVTKAAVNSTDYPDALNMYVFAMAGANGATVPGGFTEPYFVNAEFTHRSGLTEHIFGGTTPYYWPNVKHLIFSGYSKSGNVASKLTGSNVTSYSTADGISIVGYAPGYGTDLLGDNDLMWFPTTTTSYGKQVDAINVTMKHACSWITLNIKGDDVTGSTGTSWKIHTLELDEVSKSGDVKLGNTATWSNPSGEVKEKVFDLNAGVALTTAFVDYTDGTTTGESYKGLILIPQAACDLKITYSYVPQPGVAPISETATVSLNFGDDNIWDAGVHYTYNITIGATEILILPVAADWDE